MTKILVLPGIGDIHWVALKLRSFCERNGITDPEVHVWNFDGRPRSLEFVKMLPMCTAGEYWHQPMTNAYNSMFKSAYLFGNTDCISPFAEFDHFICVNGSLRNGKNFVHEVLPGCATEWDYKLTFEDGPVPHEPYFLLYFSDNGMFAHWLRKWNIRSIAKFLGHLYAARPHHQFILTGSSWDRAFTDKLVAECNFPLLNMTGETKLHELFALVSSADAFIGWCGGNTIVSTHLGTQTFMLWSNYFQQPFYTNWVRPDRIDSTYHWMSVDHYGHELAAAKIIEKLNRTKHAAAI